jgi:exonuclease SbcC
MRLDEKKGALEEQERPERTLAELEAEIARLEGDVAALGEVVDLDAMAEKLAQLKLKLTEAEAAEATARTAAGKAETDLAGARAKLDTVIEALPEGLRTPEAVVARREALQRESKGNSLRRWKWRRNRTEPPVKCSLVRKSSLKQQSGRATRSNSA